MINCLDLLREKGIDAKKVAMTKGGEYHSRCPGCGGEDKPGDPSNRFHVWPAEKGGDGSWWCRQCEKGGDSITFVMEFDGLSYPEACRRLGKDLPRRQLMSRPRPPAPDRVETWQPHPEDPPPPKLWQEKAGRFVDWAHEKLLVNSSRRAWLKKRGITIEAIRKHRLGWNPGKGHKDLWRPRESWGLETILKGKRKKRLWLPRGLVIPNFEETEGRRQEAGDRKQEIGEKALTRIRIRTLAGKPPYYVLPGSSMNPMQTGTRSQESGVRVFVIVEAELDGIVVGELAGDLINVVAMGSSSARPRRRLAAALEGTIVILFALDYDEAGNAALAWWKKQYPQTKPWRVPDGKDPGEAFQRGVDLKEWVMEGLPAVVRTMADKQGAIFGPFLNNYKKKGQESGEKNQETGDRSQKTGEKRGVPAGVKELAGLLKAHPVSIRITPERTYLREAQAWARQHWEISRRISELVFMTPDVVDWLEASGESLVTAENIINNN